MKFPKPIFDELKRHYDERPESVHDCSRIYRKKTAEADVYTSATRMCEALVLAVRLVVARADIAALNELGGNGRRFLLGNFGYKANLCPHGLGRGARDVSYFLQDHWGRPTKEWAEVSTTRDTADKDAGADAQATAIRGDLRGQTGIVGFYGISGFPGQGALSLFERDQFIGNAYWNCRKITFWKLD